MYLNFEYISKQCETCIVEIEGEYFPAISDRFSANSDWDAMEHFEIGTIVMYNKYTGEEVDSTCVSMATILKEVYILGEMGGEY